jgi:hypothetical protein
MESQLYDSSTIPGQEFAESFFSRVPTDSRFLQTSFQKVMPSSSIDADVIEFNFERYTGKITLETKFIIFFKNYNILSL